MTTKKKKFGKIKRVSKRKKKNGIEVTGAVMSERTVNIMGNDGQLMN